MARGRGIGRRSGSDWTGWPVVAKIGEIVGWCSLAAVGDVRILDERHTGLLFRKVGGAWGCVPNSAVSAPGAVYHFAQLGTLFTLELDRCVQTEKSA